MTIPAGGGTIDVEHTSGGRFPADPSEVYQRWDEFRDWGEATVSDHGPMPEDLTDWGPPSPLPRQVFGIGMNYPDHVAEAGHEPAVSLTVFTKFPTCVAGPRTQLVLPSDRVDWEAELVVVIGRRASRVPAEQAWSYVAGLTVGQDYSERAVQMAGRLPQFCLGKSFPGFGPTGPWLVTPDACPDRDDLLVECLLNGETMQKARTSSMIFPVPELIARLSAICPLLPGDLIFTGTPSGVGAIRKPQRFLVPGDEVVTRIEGIGELRQICVGAPS